MKTISCTLSFDLMLATDMCYILIGVWLAGKLYSNSIVARVWRISFLQRWKELHYWPHKLDLDTWQYSMIYFHVIYNAGSLCFLERSPVILYPADLFVGLIKCLLLGECLELGDVIMFVAEEETLPINNNNKLIEFEIYKWKVYLN